MDRDGFVEFVQRTSVKRKTKGRSRYLDHGLLNAIAQSVHVACINKLASATPETCSLFLRGLYTPAS